MTSSGLDVVHHLTAEFDRRLCRLFDTAEQVAWFGYTDRRARSRLRLLSPVVVPR